MKILINNYIKVECSKRSYANTTETQQYYYYIAKVYKRGTSQEQYTESHVVREYTSTLLNEIAYKVTEYLKTIGIETDKVKGLQI